MKKITKSRVKNREEIQNFIQNILIREDDYEIRMKNEVIPFAKNILQQGELVTEDGLRLKYYYAVNGGEKGSVVFSHGFCEFVGKYYEMLYYFYRMGYSVFLLEHRGHGNSDREVSGFEKVHVESYLEYIRDFHKFIKEVVVKKKKTKDLKLFAHSMGGCIGALYLEKFPSTFKKAILSSPMIEMNTDAKKWELKAVIFFTKLFGLKKKYVPGGHGFNKNLTPAGSNSISEKRFKYILESRIKEPRYRTTSPTNGWLIASLKASHYVKNNARDIRVPVLLCQASEDKMVINAAQDKFAHKLKKVKLSKYQGSRHEIFNATTELRERFYREVFAFLEM
ncbi:lysophospholipase [Lachnospiraceae bacterium C7]|nr:lysophospholipase [Lachnospiraceae bacterium C7]